MSRETLKSRKKPQIHLTGIALTPAEVKVLQRMSSEATDAIGRTISVSAVQRALIQWVGKRELKFIREEIVPLVEKEMSLLRWGRRKES
jgi:hypothetical protein